MRTKSCASPLSCGQKQRGPGGTPREYPWHYQPPAPPGPFSAAKLYPKIDGWKLRKNFCMAERVGFEPTYPITGVTRFRVELVTTASIPLRAVRGRPSGFPYKKAHMSERDVRRKICGVTKQIRTALSDVRGRCPNRIDDGDVP